MNVPGFTADNSLLELTRQRVTSSPLIEFGQASQVIPAVPMPYCKTVCGWEVCGSPLPGYPPPMCYTCHQECWIHDSGPYSGVFSL